MYLMPGGGGWMVVVDNNYLDEINRAPDEVLSFEAAIEDVRIRPNASHLHTDDNTFALSIAYSLDLYNGSETIQELLAY